MARLTEFHRQQGPTFSSLMPSTLPFDMLGGLAKANIWVVRPEG
jgi:hypothetical protein